MRQSLQKLTLPIQERFTYLKDDDVDAVIAVELMAVAIHLMDMRLSVKDAWILFTGFQAPITPVTGRKDILMKIRILLQDYRGEFPWTRICQQYEKLEQKHVLVEDLADEKVPFRTLQVFHDRVDYYERVLSKPLRHKKTNKQVLPSNSYEYVRHEDSHIKTFSATFSKVLLKETSYLQAYKEKKPVAPLSVEELLTVAKEVDEKLGGKDWQNRVSSLNLKNIRKNKGVQHIIGGLAAGKSSYRDLMTYHAIQNKGARVLIIENKVTNVYEKANFFHQLGISVAPITGIYRQKQNFQDITENHVVHTKEDLETNLAYTYLTGACMIRSLANDLSDKDETIPYLPCRQLKEKNKQKQYLCPLIEHCGIYQAQNELKSADLWITTEAALLSMTLPAMIDPYERTLYEAAYDLVDLIFVDEADHSKITFENKFVTEIPLYAAGNSPTNQLHIEAIQLSNNPSYEPREEIIAWRYTTSHLSINTEQLYQLIGDNKDIKKYMQNNIVYLNRLKNRITYKLQDNQGVKKELEDYAKNANYHSEEPLSGLGRITNRVDKISRAKAWFKQHKINFSSQEALYESIDELYLYIYLANIQYALGYIQGNRYMIQKYHLQADDLLLDHKIKDFTPFIREPMTGLKYGFRFDGKKQSSQIQLLIYQGIGLDLLYQWHDLYESISDQAGPEIIYLSGTSYVKGSPHYHLALPVDWTLSSKRKLPKIDQFILPLPDENSLLYVSGQRLENRGNALRKMIDQLSDQVLAEIKYWKEKGQDRRILFIVNSYRDVEVVHDALSNNHILAENYLVLTREIKDAPKHSLHHSKIRNLHERREKIFTTPLLAMNRGYNILQKDSNESLFGSVFFLTRPYPTPNDLQYFVQYLHGMYPSIMDDIKEQELKGVAALRALRRKSNIIFNKMFQEKGTWTNLTDEERKVLALFTFIPIWQLIGRLLRGGTDARVFYCDAKFFSGAANQPTMLDYWEEILTVEDEHFQALYGPFIKGLNELKEGVE